VKITGVKTDAGNELLRVLKQEGWRVLDQYSPLAFDKGIDFDSYTLGKGGEPLRFEWTNWFEWDIEGSEPVLNDIRARRLVSKVQPERQID
jgi:hypothetical protein